MGKYIPLLIALRGRLGAWVYAKDNTVRAYVPTQQGGDRPAQCAFAALAKQWPYSDALYKDTCAAIPRRGQADGGLTRQVPFLCNAASIEGEWSVINGESLLSDRLAELAGKFGCRYELKRLELYHQSLQDRIQIELYWDYMTSADHVRYYAYIVVAASLAVSGHTEQNLFAPWLGVVAGLWPHTEPGDSVMINDFRQGTDPLPAGRYFVAVVTWYWDEQTGMCCIDSCGHGAANIWTASP